MSDVPRSTDDPRQTEASADHDPVDEVRKEAVVRASGGFALVGIGLHLLLSGVGDLLSLQLLSILYLLFAAVGILVGAGLLVEAGVRAVRVAYTRGAIRGPDHERAGRSRQSGRSRRRGD